MRARRLHTAAALALTLGLALALQPAAAGAQPDERPAPGAAPRLPDVPAGQGALRGRVVAPADAAGTTAGVQVFLYGVKESGEGGLRATRADSEGRFVFEGISAEADIAYLLIARYDGVPYPGERLRFEPGGPLEREVELRVAVATRQIDRVSRVASRVLVDPDAVAFVVREAHTIAVAGEEWVVAPEGGRLLRIPLPEGVESLRFDAASALGLAPDPEGGLALQGPLPPGESTVNLQYRLPASPELVRRFGGAVPLVTVYVADSGDQLFESDRLHRRRPVRTNDRTYAHFEAFEVAAEEEIRLSLGTLPRRAALSRPARLGLFGLLAAGVIGAVVAPLRGTPSDETLGSAGESAARRERDAVYAALQDLEHDHETQKVSAEDYGPLRDELRARAVVLLRAEREAAETGAVQATHAEPPIAETPATCPACETELRAGDRFCAHCGHALATPDESEARG